MLLAGGSWSGATYTAEKAGIWTVNGIYLSNQLLRCECYPFCWPRSARLHYNWAKICNNQCGWNAVLQCNCLRYLRQQLVVLAIYSCPNPNIVISAKYCSLKHCWIVSKSQEAFGGKTDSVTLTVIGNLPVTEISITPDIASVKAGNSQKFTATATDGLCNLGGNRQVTWIIKPEAGGSWIKWREPILPKYAGTWIVTGNPDANFLTLEFWKVLQTIEDLSHINNRSRIPSHKNWPLRKLAVTAYDQYGNIVGDVDSYATSAPGD